jgi:hypothetical protein
MKMGQCKKGNRMKTLLDRVMAAARTHGEESAPEYEIGDLKMVLMAAFTLLGKSGQEKLLQNDEVAGLLVAWGGETLGFKAGVYTVIDDDQLNWFFPAKGIEKGDQVTCDFDDGYGGAPDPNTILLSRCGEDFPRAWIWLADWRKILRA